MAGFVRFILYYCYVFLLNFATSLTPVRFGINREIAAESSATPVRKTPLQSLFQAILSGEYSVIDR
jgi:hypothetical protein